MTGNLTFRSAVPADLEALAALAHRAEPTGWTLGNFQDALKSGYDVLLAFEGPSLVGYSVTMMVIDEAELLEIGVDPDLQGRRIGTRLLSCALSRVKARAAQRVHLEVRAGNSVAQRLYASSGFTVVGRRKAYYPPFEARGTREDALLMTLATHAEPNASAG
ncbi:MAG: ribosomal protein S18-alanine N-acetyltransferase [Duodenibacillus sp.]